MRRSRCLWSHRGRGLTSTAAAVRSGSLFNVVTALLQKKTETPILGEAAPTTTLCGLPVSKIITDVRPVSPLRAFGAAGAR